MARFLAPLAYLAAIAEAEVLTATIGPAVGLPLHGVILLTLLYHGSVSANAAERALLWGLTLAPVIRILSLALPLASFPVVYWFAIISAPLFIATAAGAHALGYSAEELGLVPQFRFLPLYVVMVPFGIGLGLVEHWILRAAPLATSLAPQAVLPDALILTVSTGFCEEIIFRGLLQRAAVVWLGTAGGIAYVSVLFASLHAGYLSWFDFLFVLTVGAVLAVMTQWSRSVYAAALCHSTLNVTFYLIWPILLPAVQQVLPILAS